MKQFDEDMHVCMKDGNWRTAADIATEMEDYRRRQGPRTAFQRFLFATLSRAWAELLVYDPPLARIFSRLYKWEENGKVERRPHPEDSKRLQWRLKTA